MKAARSASRSASGSQFAMLWDSETVVACVRHMPAEGARPSARFARQPHQLFETVERRAKRALPQDDYGYAEWRLARVGIDDHVEVHDFLYSVPYTLIREQVDIRATDRTIEVFHRRKRVAAHARRYGGPRHGTQPEHMPSAHRRYAEWTPERLQRQARGIGPC